MTKRIPLGPVNLGRGEGIVVIPHAHALTAPRVIKQQVLPQSQHRCQRGPQRVGRVRDAPLHMVVERRPARATDVLIGAGLHPQRVELDGLTAGPRSLDLESLAAPPVSYTHLTLPTI